MTNFSDISAVARQLVKNRMDDNYTKPADVKINTEMITPVNST